MLPQGRSGGSNLQPGLGSTDLDIFHPTGQSPLSDFQKIDPLVLAMKLGWGGERVGESRGGAHSRVGTTDPHRWDEEGTAAAGVTEAHSGDLEPLVSDRGLGWAREAARLVGYQETGSNPGPGPTSCW